MSKKVTFIGGGSSKFIYELARDLFTFPAMQDVTISLMDIDEVRVHMTEALVNKMITDLKINAKVEAGTDRRKMLAGADYVIVTIMVGRFDVYGKDVDIPAKYGVKQAVSDTIGPGGVFRFMRTYPVLEGLVKDIRDVAPGAWILNYSNPMAMNVWGILETGYERVVGLCHSVQWTYTILARAAGIDPAEVTYTAGGINHVNFYLTLQQKGKDIYPAICAAAHTVLKEHPEMKTSFELLDEIGYFPAEAGWHQSEYYPYFRKNDDLINSSNAPTKTGYTFDKANADKMAIEIPAMTRGEKPISYKRGHEYGSFIINAIETNEPFVFYGNVRNNGLIENHLPDAVVEVPCVADRTGIRPCRVGRIPEILAALQRAHVSVHSMAVKGTIAHDREMIIHALMADPLTATICTLPQIRAMANEMFAANREWLIGWGL